MTCFLQVIVEDADFANGTERVGRVAEEQSGGSGFALVADPPEEVSLEAIERGIRWPDPITEPAFWERPPRDEPLSLGEASPFPDTGSGDTGSPLLLKSTAESRT